MKLKYRSIKQWKYQTIATWEHQTEITGYRASTRFIDLYEDGRIIIYEWYGWDGPSGPTIDTADFMRGSLLHDALYQLIRLKLLPLSCKNQADEELRKLCLEDNMSPLRVSYVLWALNKFGGPSCIPGSEQEQTIYEVGGEE